LEATKVSYILALKDCLQRYCCQNIGLFHQKPTCCLYVRQYCLNVRIKLLGGHFQYYSWGFCAHVCSLASYKHVLRGFHGRFVVVVGLLFYNYCFLALDVTPSQLCLLLMWRLLQQKPTHNAYQMVRFLYQRYAFCHKCTNIFE
jgi:hypothetical protein